MPARQYSCNPEMWGGLECTIARIGDTYKDQLLMTGHYGRPSDIDDLAALGIRAIRYPLLWERLQPDLSTTIDWCRSDAQLDAIRGHHITPILGLLHHGSGPVFTQLDDPLFAGHFAAYAARVATRYPWVQYYTPINEPLTTARFSGLYGVWYPHQKSAYGFTNMLLNQLKAIVEAMKAIRRINPAAKLVQTEDLARIHSTPALAYQADFENQRRWLTFDILCGKLDRSHPLWNYLLDTGIEEARLSYFIDNPCIPDILGANYYITSERYLDDNIHLYTDSTHGGNGRHVYADVEAIRSTEPTGLYLLLSELAERYHLPIALTEVHLNCTREEQARWLYEAWHAACSANRSGWNVVAVTSWALLGAYDWDSLLTRTERHYESGAYTIENNQLRMTAIGFLVQALANGIKPDHPLLRMPGWWNRRATRIREAEPLLIYGNGKQSSKLLPELCSLRGIPYRLINRPEMTERDISTDMSSHNAWGFIEIDDGMDEMNRAELNQLLDLLIDKALAENCKSLVLNYG